MLIQIKKSNQEDTKQFALFNLGFRPFFLGASVFAVVSIMLWIFVYFSNGFANIELITASQWHAHEMLYGYSMAVVAGFLLTAVKNWTGIPTLFEKMLNHGGIYIIEDILSLDIQLPEFKKLGDCEVIDNRKLKNRFDDILIIFRFCFNLIKP